MEDAHPRKNDVVPDRRSDDPALDAATSGWGTTLRYALLLLVRRGSVGLGALLLLDFAHRSGVL
ncbi:hypothetical protein C1701_07825 [Actinoalloteichus sp. AHMU CJ021]|uniref:Uncharacterized protein n=1 Tax=Actinoalloteichus caeruleus DSM 43889 TaxID=1120930 RepID=A0ABT1JIL8_ACTCY|nr:hypothetical protein [Actinoalloteichus caeruleus]AUS78290.1 hypothetical protein C1701_07825 [Actinoalloteichus sp. AHMU CJ021]MCP2332355.1 hypothetical protein [Actinoalloteichus caeruleus DSM 43889]